MAATIVSIQVMVITLIFGLVLPLWAVIPAALILFGEICVGIFTMFAAASIVHR